MSVLIAIALLIRSDKTNHILVPMPLKPFVIFWTATNHPDDTITINGVPLHPPAEQNNHK